MYVCGDGSVDFQVLVLFRKEVYTNKSTNAYILFTKSSASPTLSSDSSSLSTFSINTSLIKRDNILFVNIGDTVNNAFDKTCGICIKTIVSCGGSYASLFRNSH